jgi:hypothetical protein
MVGVHHRAKLARKQRERKRERERERERERRETGCDDPNVPFKVMSSTT